MVRIPHKHFIVSWLIFLVLTSLGEKLSDDEVEELLKGVNVAKDGTINYTGNDSMLSPLTTQSLYR
jgi:Ca2+-binding EF-hand superfamily protein